MIKSITVTNYVGDSIKLELMKPQASGFIIQSITGLGPGAANINTSEVSTNDGSLFNSARVPSRNIVISIKYLWKETIEQARHLSYKYFPIKRKVTLLIETDHRMAQIEGYVETNDPDIFSSDEGTEVSIICPYPFFYDAYQTQSASLSGIRPLFEFEFSNESLTEPLLEFSELRDATDCVISYAGDHEIGITIGIRAISAPGNISIYNVETQEVMHIYSDSVAALTGSGISAGDEITICTEVGRKSATLLRNGVATNILNCLNKDADWFMLVKGDNTFAYTAANGENEVRMEIRNRVIYEGV